MNERERLLKAIQDAGVDGGMTTSDAIEDLQEFDKMTNIDEIIEKIVYPYRDGDVYFNKDAIREILTEFKQAAQAEYPCRKKPLQQSDIQYLVSLPQYAISPTILDAITRVADELVTLRARVSELTGQVSEANTESDSDVKVLADLVRSEKARADALVKELEEANKRNYHNEYTKALETLSDSADENRHLRAHWEVREESLNKQLAAKTAEVEAYKKAKQENDERFMNERDEAREQLTESELQLAGANLRADKNEKQLATARTALDEMKRNVVDVILPNAKQITLDMGQLALWHQCCNDVDKVLSQLAPVVTEDKPCPNET
jgi:chromosome segregation ATPase